MSIEENVEKLQSPEEQLEDIEIRFDGIVNAFSGMGMAANDRHVHNKPGGRRRQFAEEELDTLYEAGRYTQVIVDRPPRDATRAGWQIILDDHDENDPFAPTFNRLRVPEKFRRAHTLARHTGGGAALIIMDDPAPLHEPVDEERIGKVKAIHTFDRFELYPVEWDNDIESENYGEPVLYELNPTKASPILDVSGTPSSHRDRVLIHYSRIARFLGRPLRRSRSIESYDGWAQPILEAAWQAISDLTTVSQAAASTAHQFQYGVLKLKDLMSLLTGPQGEPSNHRLMQRLTAIKLGVSYSNYIVLDADREEFEQRNVDFTGIEKAYHIAQQNFSAAIGMPLTLIFGQSPAGFATTDESGLENYYSTVLAYQEEYYKPALLKVARYIALSDESPISEDQIENLDVRFEPLNPISPETEADVRLKTAQMDRVNVQSGVYGPMAVRKRFEEAKWSMEITLDDESDLEDLEQDKEGMAGDVEKEMQFLQEGNDPTTNM